MLIYITASVVTLLKTSVYKISCIWGSKQNKDKSKFSAENKNHVLKRRYETIPHAKNVYDRFNNLNT